MRYCYNQNQRLSLVVRVVSCWLGQFQLLAIWSSGFGVKRTEVLDFAGARDGNQTNTIGPNRTVPPVCSVQFESNGSKFWRYSSKLEKCRLLMAQSFGEPLIRLFDLPETGTPCS